MNTRIFRSIILGIALVMPLVILLGYDGIPPSLSSNDGHENYGIWYDIMHGSIVVYMMALYAKYRENAFIWVAIGIVLILAADMYNYHTIHTVVTVLTMATGVFSINWVNRPIKGINQQMLIISAIVVVLVALSFFQRDYFYFGEWLIMALIGYGINKLENNK